MAYRIIIYAFFTDA